MTFTDEELKEYIVAFFENNDQIPPNGTIAAKFNSHFHPVRLALERLENEGFLKKNVLGKYMFSRG